MGLHVHVGKDGVDVIEKGNKLAPGCNEKGTGPAVKGVDAVALRTCALALARRWKGVPGKGSLELSADSGVAYKDVLTTIDAFRGSAKATIYPTIPIVPTASQRGPKGGEKNPFRSQAPDPKATSAPRPAYQYRDSPKPTEEPNATIIIVSKSAILLGVEVAPVLELPPRSAAIASGVGATHKQGRADGVLIAPLAKRLATHVKTHKLPDGGLREAVVVADGMTPWRVIYEVVYTLGQAEFARYHLMMMKEHR